MTVLSRMLAGPARRRISNSAAKQLFANNMTKQTPLVLNALANSSKKMFVTGDANSGFVLSKRAFSSGEKMEFKAETKKLLDIVAKSLYTDKEVFIRELISNASDACEKLRFLQTSGNAPEKLSYDGQDLKIHLSCDESLRQFCIQDFGVGMTREELISNLGTIAKSGSLDFLQNTTGSATTSDQASTIIGQFGVGFYSSFVVADKIEVFTQSADASQPGWKWESDGSGEYTVSALDADTVVRGTKIVLSLKEECAEFSKLSTIKSCAKKFSSFVDFPLFINETPLATQSTDVAKINNTDDSNKLVELNKQQPLWLKTSWTQEEHVDFYRYLNGTSYGEPFYTLQFNSDVPLTIKSVFYIPEDPPSRYFAKEPEIGVALHCRRVLVKKNADGIIPRWMHWLKGVVDCEDMPLNVSRENMQDSRLMDKLSMAVVRRFLRFLNTESKKDPEKYMKFYKNYSYYLKAGMIEDREFGGRHKDELTKLLRFESTQAEDGEMISLEDYVDKHCQDGKQKNIYYFSAPNRQTAMWSPYLEQFTQRKRNVLLFLEDIDEFVISSVLDGYKDKKLVSIDSQNEDFELEIDTPLDSEKTGEEGKGYITPKVTYPDLTVDDQAKLEEFLKETLGQRVMDVKFTERLVNSPAVVTSVLTPHMRKMMKTMMAAQGQKQNDNEMPMTFEINPKHDLIKTLFHVKDSNPLVAKMAAETLFDNATIAAGVLDEPRNVLPRMNKIVEMLVYQGAGHDFAQEAADAEKAAKDAEVDSGSDATAAASATETSTSTESSEAGPSVADTTTSDEEIKAKAEEIFKDDSTFVNAEKTESKFEEVSSTTGTEEFGGFQGGKKSASASA